MTVSSRFVGLFVILLAAFPLLAAAPTPIECVGGPALSPLDTPGTPLPNSEFFTPEPTPLAPPCHGCIPGFSSPVMTGSGPDCTSATTDLRTQLSAYSYTECSVESPYGRCEFYVIHTTPCYDAQTTKTILRNGYANFSCWMQVC